MQNRTTIQITEELRQELRRLAARRDLSYEELLRDMLDLFRELEPGKALVSLPADLVERLREKQADTDCRSVSEYVTFLLRLILYESIEPTEPLEDISKEMRQRLQSLGYL